MELSTEKSNEPGYDYINGNNKSQGQAGFSVQKWISEHPDGEEFLNRILPDINRDKDKYELRLYSSIIASSIGMSQIIKPPIRNINDLKRELSNPQYFNVIGLEDLDNFLVNRDRLHDRQKNIFRAFSRSGELLVVSIINPNNTIELDEVQIVCAEKDFQAWKALNFP